AGAVIALWDLDGDAATVERWPAGPVPLALYVGGPGEPAPFASDVEVRSDRLAAGGMVARFDADAGGLLDTLRLGGGPVVASQVDASKGNGVATPAGPLSAQDVPGTLVVLDEGPVTAAVVASAQLENASGAVDVTNTWRVFAGRPELLVRTRYVARSGVAILGSVDRTQAIRPFQAVGPAGGACVADAGLAWADVSTPADGFTWCWATPPAWLSDVGCAAEETWSAANDLEEGEPGQGPSGHVPAGIPIADGPLLVLLPHGAGGAVAVEATRESWSSPIGVEVGPPAWSRGLVGSGEEGR
ncbi:MAG: hypothetical protein KC621_29430, partial [Myxococcales bacterium]|nr:hypothetical protein [Myxococcales bacterium]